MEYISSLTLTLILYSTRSIMQRNILRVSDTNLIDTAETPAEKTDK